MSGILASELVGRIIPPFKSDRDIHKQILEIPFPKYSALNALHKELAAAGAAAAERAAAFVATAELAKSLGRARNQVREAIADELKEIDKLVKRLLKGRIS